MAELTKSRGITRLATPAVATFLLAPVIGEVLSTSTPLPGFILAWIPLALLYGCGALLCRELSLRWGTGWVGLVILGAAYGIVEEGLVVRSFFDPTWQDIGDLGVYGRAIGVNWIWTLLLILFHMAVSVGVTIAIVEMLFPDRKADRWLGRRGMVASSLVLLGISGLGFFLYTPSPVHLIVAVLSIGALGVAARSISYDAREKDLASVPRPRRFFVLGFAAIAGVFVTTGIGVATGVHAAVTAAVMVVITAGAAGLVLRWSGRTTAWDDRHRLALVAGIIAFLTLIGVGTLGGVGLLTAVATAGALWWLHRRVEDRKDVPGPRSRSTSIDDPVSGI